MRFWPFVRVVIPVASILAFISFALSPAAEKPSGTSAEQIARGRYLVTICGCNDCHSPKVMSPHGPIPNPAKLLSGHPAEVKLPDPPANVMAPDKWAIMASMELTAWTGPWGVSYTANLTPDPATGLGGWSEEIFIKSIRTGKHMGTGRQILPPMPWDMIGKMKDQDLKDVFAYLKSIPPVKNLVPQPVPPAAAK